MREDQDPGLGRVLIRGPKRGRSTLWWVARSDWATCLVPQVSKLLIRTTAWVLRVGNLLAKMAKSFSLTHNFWELRLEWGSQEATHNAGVTGYLPWDLLSLWSIQRLGRNLSVPCSAGVGEGNIGKQLAGSLLLTQRLSVSGAGLLQPHPRSRILSVVSCPGRVASCSSCKGGRVRSGTKERPMLSGWYPSLKYLRTWRMKQEWSHSSGSQVWPLEQEDSEHQNIFYEVCGIVLED